MQYPLCRQIKVNGLRCKAPALLDQTYCYFHDRLNRRHSSFRHAGAARGYLIPGQHLELCSLEDRESVQIALSVVINALATGQLDTRRATALLYGLQIASANAARLNFTPYAPSVVRSAESTPDGLDLAEPGAILDLARLALQYQNEEDEEDEEQEDDEDREYEDGKAGEQEDDEAGEQEEEQEEEQEQDEEQEGGEDEKQEDDKEVEDQGPTP
jgi:hypothetical protein